MCLIRARPFANRCPVSQFPVLYQNPYRNRARDPRFGAAVPITFLLILKNQMLAQVIAAFSARHAPCYFVYKANEAV